MDMWTTLETALGRQVEGLAREDLPAVQALAARLASAVAAYAALAAKPGTPVHVLEVARGDVITATVLLHQEVERRLLARGVALGRTVADVALAVLLGVLQRP